jgi:8-oxo-dGTP pyrophosphatase MutT (NUDIX family)
MDRRLREMLTERLARPLPGPVIGSKYEPQPRLERHYEWAPPEAREAAVLILLYPHEDRWHVPLTLRPAHLPAHAGQVSLPGGALDPGETGREAALREFFEELGAAGHPIEVLGQLSPIYVRASNFRVEPWLALTERRPDMAPNPAEVEKLLEVPLEHLLDPANFGFRERAWKGHVYSAPHFLVAAHQVWGATCMLLGELVTVLEEIGFRED